MELFDHGMDVWYDVHQQQQLMVSGIFWIVERDVKKLVIMKINVQIKCLQ
jgi:hypothetical protein